MSNCPNVLTEGTCSDPGCVHTHAILTCEPCALVFTKQNEYRAHFSSRRHRNRISGSSITSHCPICSINVTGKTAWDQHVSGRRHCKNAEKAVIAPTVLPQPASSTGNQILCDLCQFVVKSRHWDKHTRSPRHISREAFTKYQSALAISEADKHDIVVEGVFDFGFVAPEFAVVGVEHVATISTSAPFSKCILAEAKLASAHGARTVASRCVFTFSLDSIFRG
jgi:helicase MOV-10